MLQRAVWSQLARIETLGVKQSSHWSTIFKKKRGATAVNYPGPVKDTLNHVVETLRMLPDEQHWFCGGLRSACVAVDALRKNQVIAVPTDTIYGFAALAQNKEAIDNLYAIKGRAKTKPLAITLSTVREIREWAEIDHVPFRLLTDLLPGPVTVVLKRKRTLNPALNPGHDSVGIRVPKAKFIRYVCKLVGEPLALTSANVSNEPSSVHPDEFSSLWAQLGPIFYEVPDKNLLMESQRVGSTVVDLTELGKFKILRKGVRFHRDKQILMEYLMPINDREELLDRRQHSTG